MARIVTLTINSAIDVMWEVDEMVPIRKLRSAPGTTYPGGGGINVSRAIKILGGDSIAVVTAGWFTGHLLEEMLDALGLERHCVPVKGRTRLSATIRELCSGQEFRVTPSGPELSEDEWQAFLDAATGLEADWIVATGSLARGVPNDFYARIAATAKERGAKVVLDTSGRPLFEALEAGVHLVKPNLRELEHLIGKRIQNEQEQEDACREIIDQGRAEVVALTLGADGALVVSREAAMRLPTPEVDVQSTVGAGDTFVAALTYALSEGRSLEDAAVLAVAASTATVMTPGTELCRREDVDRLYAELKQG